MVVKCARTTFPWLDYLLLISLPLIMFEIILGTFSSLSLFFLSFLKRTSVVPVQMSLNNWKTERTNERTNDWLSSKLIGERRPIECLPFLFLEELLCRDQQIQNRRLSKVSQRLLFKYKNNQIRTPSSHLHRRNHHHHHYWNRKKLESFFAQFSLPYENSMLKERENERMTIVIENEKELHPIETLSWSFSSITPPLARTVVWDWFDDASLLWRILSR